MSAEKVPTLSSSLYCYGMLLHHIQELKLSDFARNHANVMAGLDACSDKLSKYLNQSTGESDPLYFSTGGLSGFLHVQSHLTCAVQLPVLDPRYKRTPFSSPVIGKFFSERWVEDSHRRLLRFAESDFSGTARPESPIKRRKEPAKSKTTILADPAILGVASSSRSQRTKSAAQEMSAYLAGELADRNDSPLDWWKHHEREFPILSRMARIYLAIPGIPL